MNHTKKKKKMDHTLYYGKKAPTHLVKVEFKIIADGKRLEIIYPRRLILNAPLAGFDYNGYVGLYKPHLYTGGSRMKPWFLWHMNPTS